MRVTDLLHDEALGLIAPTAGSPQSLETPITGFAQSEMISPGKYISPGEILATHGMGMNVQDERTWLAYVERLTDAKVSALVFGLGASHPEAPKGLTAACAHIDLPLFIATEQTPLVKVSRHIWRALETERYVVARTGWNLADSCARLATHKGSISDVLSRLAVAVDGNVELLDATGAKIAGASNDRAGVKTAPRTNIRLPGEGLSPFELSVRSAHPKSVLNVMLGPATGVLAMQLSYLLTDGSPLHSPSAARLFEALLDPSSAQDRNLDLAVAAGFSPQDQWDVIMLKRTDNTPKALLRLSALRLRMQMELSYERVQLFDETHHATLLMQNRAAGEELPSVITDLTPHGEDIDVGYLSGLQFEELATTLAYAHRSNFRHGVHRLKTLDLHSLVSSLPGGAARFLAEQSLSPLRGTDANLEATLFSYLRHGGRSTPVCEELFIHRNTLAYRLRRIENLLEVDLADGSTRASLMLAIEVLQQASPSN